MEQNLGLNELQTRVQQGDAVAARELGRRLKPIIACFVRRTLYLPAEESRLDRLVRAEISRMSMPVFEERMAEELHLVAQFVACICITLLESLLLGLSPRPCNR